MANILYGVNGEGAGHSTRSTEVILHLQQRGHTVHVVSFDRGLRNLSQRFEVKEIYGLRFAYVNNRVRYKRTLAKNLITAPQAVRGLVQLIRQMREWGIDLVCTDFEPLSCRAGRRRHLPVISIDNQHCLTNTHISYPRQYRAEAALAQLVTRAMTRGANAYLVTSFFAPRVRNARTFVFPPILRREILQAQPRDGEHVLVYVTSDNPQLARLLKQVDCRFICYGFGTAGQEANLLFKPAGLSEFLQDLTTGKAVIANSGFSLLSEALHLGKPFLACPVRRQFEQVFNAHYVAKMGYGAAWEELNKERIEAFLFNLDSYRRNLASYPRQDNSALFAKLDAVIEQYAPPQRAAATEA